MAKPGYSRLGVEERREQLLALGTELFARHSYDELSMAEIARRAGVSKALVYHYFPSKQRYFEATLERGARELEGLTRPPESGEPLERLSASIEAFLGWIETNAVAYSKLMQSATTGSEVRGLVERVRADTARQILEGLGQGPDPAPTVRTAVTGWLWFMDGACLDWVERRDMSRAALRDLLVATLTGALTAAAATAATNTG